MINNILVVCTGNICRSPMAEALLIDLSKQWPDFKVASAGIAALVNQPPAKLAQEVLLEHKNIEISHYKAKQINAQMLKDCQLILTMELAQQKEIEFNFPTACGKVHRLGKWSEIDIPDPYRRSKEFFVQALLLIEQCLQDWQVRLWK